MSADRRKIIDCPCCGKRILNGDVLLCRVLIVGRDGGSKAKCDKCKHMVSVPLGFAFGVHKAAAQA